MTAGRSALPASRPASTARTSASATPASASGANTSGATASTPCATASGPASGSMRTPYGMIRLGRSVLNASRAGLSSFMPKSRRLAVSGILAALSLASVASAASGAVDRAVSAAASRATLIPVWSHPTSARPRPTDAGTTSSRAVRLRNPSMRCRISCSFMVQEQHCTLVQRKGLPFHSRREWLSAQLRPHEC